MRKLEAALKEIKRLKKGSGFNVQLQGQGNVTAIKKRGNKIQAVTSFVAPTPYTTLPGGLYALQSDFETHTGNSIIHHTHANKSYLDTFSAADVSVLDHLFIVDGKLYTDLDFYSEKSNSAWGLGSGSGGIVTETDPIFTSHIASEITEDDYSHWTSAYMERLQWDGGTAGLNAALGRTSLGLVIGTNVEGYVVPGTSLQYRRGDKTWQTLNADAVVETTKKFIVYPETPLGHFLRDDATFAEITAGGGSAAANLYLTGGDSDVTGYYELSYINDPATSTFTYIASGVGEGLLATFLYSDAIGITEIDAGNWNFNHYSKTSSVAGNPHLRFEVFVRHAGGTETTLFTQVSTSLTSSYDSRRTSSWQLGFDVLSTDRLGLRVYGVSGVAASITFDLQAGDSTVSFIDTPLALRHSQLRGLNDDSSFLHITSTEKAKYETAHTHSQNTTTAVHGSTTLGYNLFKITNPSAITFPRFNANNTVSALTASDYRTAIGLAIGTDVLAYRTFGTAANNNTEDFLAYRTFGTAANNNTEDFLAYNGTAVNSSLLEGHAASYFEPNLGVPSVNGYLLSSTNEGSRVWVAPYSLPTASSTVLGGVKIGNGVTITDGVISVSQYAHPDYSIEDGIGGTLGHIKASKVTALDILISMFTRVGAGTIESPYAIQANYDLYSVKSSAAWGLGGSIGGGGIITETDPIFTNHVAHDIDAQDIVNWNTAHTDRFNWDGGSTGLNAVLGRASLDLDSHYASLTGNVGVFFHTDDLYVNGFLYAGRSIRLRTDDTYSLDIDLLDVNTDYAIFIHDGDTDLFTINDYGQVWCIDKIDALNLYSRSSIYENGTALSSKYAALAGNQAVAFSCSDLQSYGQVSVIDGVQNIFMDTQGIYSVNEGENMINFDQTNLKLTTWAIDASSLSESGVSLATKYALKAGSSSQPFNCANLTAYGSVAATSLSAGGSGGSSLTGTTLTIGGLAVSFGANDSAGTGYRWLRVPNA